MTEPAKFEFPKVWKAGELQAARQARAIATSRLLRAAINLLIGDEGIGKSLLWVWIVAAITTGKALPEFGIPARKPGHVMLVVTEDDWSDTVLPRLLVAGADIDMIDVICTDRDGSGAPVFPRDIQLIRDAHPVPSLIVVDCWLDTVAAGMSVRDPQQARQALGPWKDVATVTDAAVLLLCHTNRVASGNARDRYGATGVLRQKARMTLFAQVDDDGQLVVGPEKANSTAPVPASMFTIKPVTFFDPTDDNDGTVPVLHFIGDSKLTAREHVADAFDSEHGDDQQDKVDAANWLREYLQIEGPQAKSSTAKSDAKKAGFSERTLQRARKNLGVVIGYVGNPPVSTWTLPDASAARGTTRNSGITAGEGDMPRSATWHNVAQPDDQEICHETSAVPAEDRFTRAMQLVEHLNDQEAS